MRQRLLCPELVGRSSGARALATSDQHPWHQPELAASAVSSIVIGEGVLRLLRSMDAGGGVLLVLEDMHRADQESLAVLDYLADHAVETQLACVVTARPQRSPGLAVLDAPGGQTSCDQY